MSETGKTIHLIVEVGPDRGLELSIPPDGARLGRASGNDILLSDLSISRFQCRFYFKNGVDLAVADLASTNETCVNDRPAQDLQLFVGDRIMVGETTLKVVSDTLTHDPSRRNIYTAPPAPEPNLPPAPPATAETAHSPASSEDVGPIVTPPSPPHETPPPNWERAPFDLGLRPPPQAASAPTAFRSPKALLMKFGLAVAAIAMVGGGYYFFVVKGGASRTRPLGKAPAASADKANLEIQYEKEQADTKNIFRYVLTLKNRVLTIRVDDLVSGRYVRKEKEINDNEVRKLADSLEKTSFFDLDEEYTGLQPDLWEQADLTITVNRRSHRTLVRNRIPPPYFKAARDRVEEFGRNEVGLWALAMTPEKLQQMARDAFLVGQRLYNEREVRHDNLFNAIRSFTESEGYLETVEPKPEFYASMIASREEARRQLNQQYEDLSFGADHAIGIRNWEEARDKLQIIINLIPDRGDSRYQEAYKRLLDVNRRLEKK